MMLLNAFILCVVKHWNQKDKAGKRYIWHPMYVMSKVKGYDEKVVALLHDIVEDTDMTLEKLKDMKFSDEVVEAINTISKKKNQKYFEYLEGVKNNKIARNVKIEDIRHNCNLKRLKNITEKDYERYEKYKKALEYLSSIENEK